MFYCCAHYRLWARFRVITITIRTIPRVETGHVCRCSGGRSSHRHHIDSITTYYYYYLMHLFFHSEGVINRRPREKPRFLAEFGLGRDVCESRPTVVKIIYERYSWNRVMEGVRKRVTPTATDVVPVSIFIQFCRVTFRSVASPVHHTRVSFSHHNLLSTRQPKPGFNPGLKRRFWCLPALKCFSMNRKNRR